jgi:hypothetical protein
MNVMYGILNHKRQNREFRGAIQRLHGKNVVVCSSMKDYWNGFRCIEPAETIQASKNLLLREAKKEGADFLFLIEDNIVPTNFRVFEDYIALMKKYNLNYVAYAYSNGMNKALGCIPNPILVVKDLDGSHLSVARFPGDSVIGIRVSQNFPEFDEKLKHLEAEKFVFDIWKAKLHPFRGFHFDLFESWKNFKMLEKDELSRKKPSDEISADIQLVKEENMFTLDSDSVAVLDFILNRGKVDAN